MASLNDIETKVQSIIDILHSRIVKTITGILPLTFTANAGNAVDWSIDGNTQGVGERTANLVFTYLDSASIGANGLISVNNLYDIAVAPVTSNETYSVLRNYTSTGNCVYGFFTELPTYGSTTYNNSRSVNSSVSFSFVSPIDGYVAFWSHQENNRHQSTCVKGSTAPSTYIPYGYQIPITVSQQGHPGTNYNIYIGDSPLTEGETVSKTSTGVDLELFEGENTVSTTLYNKPEMTIKYKYNGGN